MTDQRKQFEDWWNKDGWKTVGNRGAIGIKEDSWLTWQAARAQPACRHNKTVTHHMGDGTPVEFCPDCATNVAVDGKPLDYAQAAGEILNDDQRLADMNLTIDRALPAGEAVARDALMSALRDMVAECAEICDVYSMYDGKSCALELRNIIMDDKISAIADRYASHVQDMPHTAPPAQVPDGWQLVPKEPTSDMEEAGRNEWSSLEPDADSCYRAMLAAAPQPKESK